MMDHRVFFCSIVGLLTAVVARYLTTRGRKEYKLPPLVPGIPIMGNAFQVPATQQGRWAKSLAEKYGEM